MKEDVNKVVGQRIKQRRKELGLSQDELAKKIGYKTKGAISYFENGLRSPDFEVVQKIAEALNTDLKYFWVEQEPQSNITHFTNDLISMPLFSSISAGYGAFIDNCFIDNEEIEYIPMIQFPNWQYCFAVRVKGDSMCPKICDGDIVVINTQFSIENNQIGAFMIDDEAFLKRKKIADDNTLLLVSNNERYAPIVVTKDKNFKEIGKLTQIISNNVD